MATLQHNGGLNPTQRVTGFDASLKMFSGLAPALQILQDESVAQKAKIRELEAVLESIGRTKRGDIEQSNRIVEEIKTTEYNYYQSLQMRNNMLSMGYKIVRDVYNDSAKPDSLIDAPPC
jgi:hypothetical protein